MTTLKKLREELDQLKAEILSKAANEASTLGPEIAKTGSKIHESIDAQTKELNRMVKAMLDEAETTVADHPVATVAGALALGIAIGRLTSR
jgi:ElaB/YqjD/DUF883 family membrane-anchored ribosome-binding protein